jgi:Undecaprenyl-phosphate glucose phosphotransferase
MLKKHSQFLESLLLLADLAIISVSWIAAYYLRFFMGAGPDKGIPPLNEYVHILLPILLIWPFIFRNMGLYRPRRMSNHIIEFFDIVKASTLAVIILVATAFFVKRNEISRLIFFYFWLTSIVALSIERGTFRELLRFLRRKGYNVRHVLIVGAGDLGAKVAKKVKDNSWIGLEVVGYLDDYKTAGETVDGKKVLGRISDIKNVINEHGVDQVFVALPVRAHKRLMYIVETLKEELVTIRVVPDIYQALTLNAGVEDLDGVPLINLTDTPMYGWNVVVKRFADIVLSLSAIIITSPVMLAIAVAVKLTSPGPLFYRQERMGLDGKTFDMLKFRSMKVDAEAQTGAVWAKENDPRRTKLGTFLRKTSLDELPQFFNVLRGDMSIVGPRPERPVFIEEFRKKIPGYMLRHKMKAGITGWAQVNGWRGNTSLEKRIECDLYYIEHWSLWFDIKIMWLTVWKGLVNKNAY